MLRQAIIRLASKQSTSTLNVVGANSQGSLLHTANSARTLVQMMSTMASSSLTNIASCSGSSAEPSVSGAWKPQLTKIVATIGPTSEQLPVMKDLVRCGLRIMRLNFSHATVEEVELRIANLKQCEGRHGNIQLEKKDGERNVRAVLLDTRGPEIRMGKLKNDFSGHETIRLTVGKEVNLRTSEDWQNNGSTETDLFIDYPKLHKVLMPGSKILLDDGAIILTVKHVESDKEFHGNVVCTIDNTGDLRSRAGVNLPGAETDLPALSAKDKVDIRYGMTKDVDYIAASFVQSAAHVREIKAYVKQCAQDLGLDPSYPLPLIISKM
jgi:Pyruvate kinase